jgi:peptidoglycan/xylan/chitin deacetylase (PgdA/CDA1 family)
MNGLLFPKARTATLHLTGCKTTPGNAMRILHVLSQFEITGAEVYAVHLAREQRRKGHEVVLVTDTQTYPYDGEVIRMPIGLRSYPQRVQNIRDIANLIRSRDIQVVNAHSRAASWVCFWACRRTGTAFVSTIHGKQHLHASSRNFNIYGKSIIVVSEALVTHVTEGLKISREFVTRIPNGFEMSARHSSTQKPIEPSSRPVVMFAGRLSGPKGDVVRILLSKVFPLLSANTTPVLRIVGGTILPPDILQMVGELQRNVGLSAVEIEGFQTNLEEVLETAHVVIGSGRVALESLLVSRPTIAFGESGFEGVVRLHTFESSAATNFGDTGNRRETNPGDVASAIIMMIRHPLSARERHELRQRVIQEYDIKVVEPAVARVYHRALGIAHPPPTLPVLMYHRVVEEAPAGSRHGIWVTAKAFEGHLKSLRRRGYTAMTFGDLGRYLDGQIALPDKPVILTFDDGYEDNHRVAYPLLQSYGMKAVIFMVAGGIGRTNSWDEDEPQVLLMNDAQLRELADAGHEIGSHTMTHPHLARIPREEVERELRNSKSRIEHAINRNVGVLAYPYGGVDETVKAIAEECGYQFGVAVNSGPVHAGRDRMEIRRAQVFPWTGPFGFWKKTQPWYLAKKARSESRSFSKYSTSLVLP